MFSVIVAELAAATNFSFLRGASHPDEMVLSAKALGLSALGVADRNTLSGVVRAHKCAKEVGLSLLIGARLVTQCGLTAIAYPKDRAAYGQLCRLLTLGNRRAPKGQCWLEVEDLIAHGAGMVWVLFPPDFTACGPDPLAGWGGERLVRGLAAPGSMFLALRRCFGSDDLEDMHRVRTLSRALGVRLLATADPLYHTPERRALADVVCCIREHTTIDQAGFLLAANAERHLHAPQEMARLFAGFEEAIEAQAEVLAQVRFCLDELAYEYPYEITAPGETAMETLRRKTEEGARGRYPSGVPGAVRAALDHEYELIEHLDYAKYFLTVHDIVAFARGQGILCQGRGSAANSVVCYCLGVTAVDPIKVDLLFERFVSPERKEPPDIDVDFEHERREEVIQYIYEKFGRHRAGIAATVICYRGRSAIREVGKAMGLSGDVIEALSRTLWGWSDGGPRDDHVRGELGLDPDAARLRLALDLTRALIGFPRHLSQHVGGFVITRGPLEELCPIGNAAMADRTFIEWDKDDIDTLGILKIDVLALGMLTAVARAFSMIESRYGRALSLADVPPEDPSVYDMICEADTVGVFQIESRAQMSMLPRLKPRAFYDLVIEVAIVRPGPIQGDMVHPYLRRREGREPVRFPSKALEKVLGKTLGVPLFQEQAMRIAIVAAGFTPAEADKLRRAMATFRKVGIIHQFGTKLVEGMVANGYERDFAERCFKQIEGFGEYGFPESHAASFALIVYVSAWLKKHYPEVFCAALLNAQPMGFYAPAQLVRDARQHGVEVLAVDVNWSDWDTELEGEAPIQDSMKTDELALPEACGGRAHRALPVRLGLRQITGFSEADAAKILAARAAGGKFQSVEDLRRRARLSPAVLAKLAHADAFRSIGLDRRAALWDAKAQCADDTPLFRALSDFGPEEDPHLPVMALCEHVAHDYARVKLSLKAHPMAFFRESFAAQGSVRSDHLATAANGRRLEIAGLVLVRQRPGSAKGVIFMTLEDEVGVANVIVWPKAFERFRPVVLGGRLISVFGKLQREGKVIHVIADRIVNHSHLLADLSDGAADLSLAGLARADEARNPREDPRQAALMREHMQAERAAKILPASRDFH
ncbi:MAG: error-prone DNA polymerase [Caulobacterales bacterium]